MKEPQYKEKPLADIKVPAWAYNQPSEFIRQRLKEVIGRTGIVENIVVRKTPDGLELVAGADLLAVLIEMKYKRAMVCIIEDLDELAAQRLAAEITETRFPVNPEALGKMLARLRERFGQDDLLRTAPLTADQLQSAIDASLSRHAGYDPNKKTRKNSTAGNATGGKTLTITLNDTLAPMWGAARKRTGETAQDTFNKLLEAYVKD